MKAAARVIYRTSWATDRPAIMQAHGWETSNSEVLIRLVPTASRAARAPADTTPSGAQHAATLWKNILVRPRCAARARVPTRPYSHHSQRSCSGARSIAIFCACLALAQGLEIGSSSHSNTRGRRLLLTRGDVRSGLLPRPSRKPQALGADRGVGPTPPTPRALRDARLTLCAVGRFVSLAGGKEKICEYNQEQCRLTAFDGRKSLIRSFPCVALLPAPAHPPTHRPFSPCPCAVPKLA